MKDFHHEKRLPALLRAFLTRSKSRAAEVSRRSGVLRPTLSNLFSGKRGADDKTLVAIANALNLSRQETRQLLIAGRFDSSSPEARDAWIEIEARVAGPEVSHRKGISPPPATHLDWLNGVIQGLANGALKVQIVPAAEGKEQPVTLPAEKPSMAAERFYPTPALEKQKLVRGRPRLEKGQEAAEEPRKVRPGLKFVTPALPGQATPGRHGRKPMSAHGRLKKSARAKTTARRKFTIGKPPAIPESAVLDYLGKTGAVTLPQMATEMGEPSHHRLIKVISGLKKTGKIVVEGRKYWLATFVAVPETESKAEPVPGNEVADRVL